MKSYETLLKENRAFAEGVFEKLNKKTLQMAIRSRNKLLDGVYEYGIHVEVIPTWWTTGFFVGMCYIARNIPPVARGVPNFIVIQVIMERIMARNVDIFAENVFGVMVHLFLDLQGEAAQNLKIRIDRLDPYLFTALGSVSHIEKQAI